MLRDDLAGRNNAKCIYTFAGTDQYQMLEYGPYSYISSATIQNAVSAISPKTFYGLFDLIPVFPRLLALIPALMAYQKSGKTTVEVENKDRIWNMIQNGPKCCICKSKRLSFPVILSQMHFVWNKLEGKVRFSGAVCKNTCHYRPSAAEKRIKNNMPNLSWKVINTGEKSRNSTEISSDWRITQCMKQWMHARISFLVIFCMSVHNFRTTEPLSKKKSSLFGFSWKVGKMQIQHFVLWPTICKSIY